MTPEAQPDKQKGKLAQFLADLIGMWNWIALATMWGAGMTAFYIMMAIGAYQHNIPISHTITYSILAAVLGPAIPIGVFLTFKPNRRKP